MLESKEMPPEGKPQPSDQDREMLINRALDLMEEINHALRRLDELR